MHYFLQLKNTPKSKVLLFHSCQKALKSQYQRIITTGTTKSVYTGPADTGAKNPSSVVPVPDTGHASLHTRSARKFILSFVLW